MLSGLKTRIKTFASAIRITRTEEYNETYRAAVLRVERRLNEAGLTEAQRERIITRAFNRGLLRAPPAIRRKANRPLNLVGLVKHIQSLINGTAEIKPAPAPEWIAAHDASRADLHVQRMRLRAQARIHHLAYGFLRGVPYRAMEQKSYSPPPWQRFRKLKEGGLELLPDPLMPIVLDHARDNPQVILQRLAEWKDAAGTWEHPNVVKLRKQNETSVH